MTAVGRKTGKRVLLIHQNFPGQFRHVAKDWRARGHEVVGLGRDTAPGMPDVTWYRYKLHREPLKKGQHPYLGQMENAVLHGQAAARAVLELQKRGFTPDVVVAHPGWGETMFLRDILPEARLIHLCEWYYAAPGGDTAFDPEFPVDLDDYARMRTWNALHALNLAQCDAAVAPTRWQRQQHPDIFREKMSVAHEGVDTDMLAPDASARFTTPNGTVLRAGDPVVTYVARNLEPYRGFHSFMRTLAIVQRQHPDCHTVIVGGDGVSYGKAPTGGGSWKEKLLQEVSLDMARTHFTGKLSWDVYRKVLQVSAAHVYLTYPFVLSWSMMEAMCSGCLIVGSRTAPVQEIVRDGENGLMVDFFDHDGIARTVADALTHPDRYQDLRQQARRDILKTYTLGKGVRAYTDLAGFS